jgi:lysophospholipase L1-like esterase
MQRFLAYIALGDSMSIDLYPALDLGQPEDTPLGASALLFRNQEKFWPQFSGRDLLSANPHLAFVNLTEDGATTWDLMEGNYLGAIETYADKPVLITITLGGNDALKLLWIEGSEHAKLFSESANIAERYEKVVTTVTETFKSATVILNTIYDPSDGTGILPALPNFADKLPFLGFINDRIRAYASTHNHLLADVHQHFLGHGYSALTGPCYYWKTSPIEPSAAGASEMRALWLKCLDL